MKTKLTIMFVLLIVAVIASACGASTSQGEVVSVLSQDEATDIIENAMQGFNDGDYAAWSRDWSYTMKNTIREENFLDFREQVITQYGQFVSIVSVTMEPGKNQGYVRWVAICNFEKGKIRMNFSFPDDDVVIEGVFPEAAE